MKIAIAGLGTVGAETARQLIHHHDQMAQRSGMTMTVTAVSARDAGRDRGFSMEGIAFEQDPVALARRDDVDLVVELIGGENGPALDLIEAALSNGKSVVTANKALLAKHGARLAALAEASGLALAGEASVAGGIPSLKMLREGLVANRISRISGILNGTCNYILSTMETTGRDFDDVLNEAQELGYAEADPSFDVDGIDAAHKLALLTAIGYGVEPDFDAISITGIRGVSAIDIAAAKNFGYAIRLLAIAENHQGSITASVQPTMVALSSGLAKVDGPLNAVAIDGEPIGSVIAIGPGAGAGPTASAVLADIVDVASGRAAPFFGAKASELSPATASNIGEVCRFYLRLTVYDRPGVLADVTAVLRDHNISVESLLQQGRSDEGVHGTVPVVLTTHDTESQSMSAAIEEIKKLDAVTAEPTLMVISGDSAHHDET